MILPRPRPVTRNSWRFGSAGPGNSRVVGPTMITRPSANTLTCGTSPRRAASGANPPLVTTRTTAVCGSPRLEFDAPAHAASMTAATASANTLLMPVQTVLQPAWFRVGLRAALPVPPDAALDGGEECVVVAGQPVVH